MVCRFTGQERQSNQNYLAKKADRYGISVNEYQTHYVSKPELLKLQDDLKHMTIATVLNDRQVDGQTLELILKVNGKSKKTLDDYKGSKAPETTPEVVPVG